MSKAASWIANLGTFFQNLDFEQNHEFLKKFKFLLGYVLKCSELYASKFLVEKSG